jgi:hypothetical protein
MKSINAILQNPSALVLLLAAILTFVGVIAKNKNDEKVARLPIEATLTAEARLTAVAIPSLTPQATSDSITSFPTETPTTIIVSSPTIFTETPIIASATYPVISTETPTLARVLFQDEFSSNINGWVVGIRENEFSQRDIEFLDGKLQYSVSFKDDGVFSWVNVPRLREKDFHLKVNTEIIQQTRYSNTGIVIAFRYINQGESSYAILFNNDATFSFQTKENGNWRKIYTGKSDAFHISEGEINTFEVMTYGQRFTVYANGQELYVLDDPTIKVEGEIGLGAYGQERDKSIIVRFDNLLITENSN